MRGAKGSSFIKVSRGKKELSGAFLQLTVTGFIKVAGLARGNSFNLPRPVSVCRKNSLCLQQLWIKPKQSALPVARSYQKSDAQAGRLRAQDQDFVTSTESSIHSTP